MVRSHGFVWLLVSLSSLALAAPLQAVITPGGDVDPTDHSWWTGGGDGLVDACIGKTAAGSVIVDLGSDLSSDDGYIGHEAGAIGEVTVAGSGSAWTNSGWLCVGLSGHGTLNITNGGAVGNDYGYIGYSSGSAGAVTVAGSSSTWTNGENIYVGSSGQGTLDITNGGAVSNTDGYIGYYSGSTGAVTVAGVGSTWINSSSLSVGGSYYSSGGTGELAVRNGGSVAVGGTLKIWGTGSLDIGATGKVGVGGALVLAQDSTLTAEPGAAIHMAGSAFINESTNSANLAGLGNVTMIFEGGEGVIDPFEVAGEDMGAVLAGFESNFALGALQLGGADIGYVQLVDDYDNQPAWAGSEALYVKNLILGAGSTLDLNGLNLYYYKGLLDPAAILVGTVIELPGIGGDANRDMAVDISDLGILAGNYEQPGTYTWADADFSGDGAVDISDLGILAGSYGSAGGWAVPEPASLTMLACGALALLRRPGKAAKRRRRLGGIGCRA